MRLTLPCGWDNAGMKVAQSELKEWDAGQLVLNPDPTDLQARPPFSFFLY